MVAIIDYKAGNSRSVERALQKLGFVCRITRDREEILSSQRVIFPGVGAAGSAMTDLRNLGLDGSLKQTLADKKPILGICLGAQIILGKSEEGDTDCLGLIAGAAKRFPNPHFDAGARLKVPHMGWNRVRIQKRHPILEGINPDDEFYFVHSYYPRPASDENVIGITEYGIDFPSVIGDKSLIAVQFHPEKSGPAGLRILKNFCDWDGSWSRG